MFDCTNSKFMYSLFAQTKILVQKEQIHRFLNKIEMTI